MLISHSKTGVLLVKDKQNLSLSFLESTAVGQGAHIETIPLNFTLHLLDRLIWEFKYLLMQPRAAGWPSIIYDELHLSKKAPLSNMQTSSLVLPAVQYLEQYDYLNTLCQPPTWGLLGSCERLTGTFFDDSQALCACAAWVSGSCHPGGALLWVGERNRVMRFLYHHPGLEKDTGVLKPSNFCPKPLQNFCGKNSHHPV